MAYFAYPLHKIVAVLPQHINKSRHTQLVQFCGLNNITNQNLFITSGFSETLTWSWLICGSLFPVNADNVARTTTTGGNVLAAWASGAFACTYYI